MSLLRQATGLLRRPFLPSTLKCLSNGLSTGVDTTANEETADTTAQGGYAQAFDRFEALSNKEVEKSNQCFASLLRNSKFIDLGDAEGKTVIGKIFHVVEDDLYIDFGWKFHCVCVRPKKNASEYVRGKRVRLLIRQLELSSKFLGFEKDLTLLEADCTLLGIIQDRNKTTT